MLLSRGVAWPWDRIAHAVSTAHRAMYPAIAKGCLVLCHRNKQMLGAVFPIMAAPKACARPTTGYGAGRFWRIFLLQTLSGTTKVTPQIVRKIRTKYT